MSKIAIAARNPTRRLALARAIRALTGLGLATTVERLAAGPLGVFFSAELFLNDHLEQERLITGLLDAMDEHGVEPWILEIPHDRAWSDLDGQDLTRHAISAAVLRQMLAEARGQFG